MVSDPTPSTPGPDRPRLGRASALLGILVLAAALRFHGLARESLWLDEGYTLAMVRQTVSENLRESLKDVHSVLYFSIVRPFVRALGETEMSLRMPSAIAGSILPLAVYALSLETLPAAAALPAALVTALSPYQITYSQEARLYSIFTLFATLSMLAFVRVLAASGGTPTGAPGGILSRLRGPSAWIALYLLLTTLCLALHHFALFLLAAQVVTAALSRRPSLAGGRRRFRVACLWLAPVLTVWVLLSILQWRGIGGFSSVERSRLDAITKTFVLLLAPDFNKPSHASLVVDILIPIAFLAAIARFGWRARREGWTAVRDLFRRPALAVEERPVNPALLLGTWLLMALVLPVVVSWIRYPIFRPRYAISAGIPLYLAIGAGLAVYPDRLRRWAVGAAGALLLVSYTLAWREGAWKEDWRSAGTLITERSTDCRTVRVEDYGYRFTLGFYLPEALRQKLEPLDPATAGPGGRERIEPADPARDCIALGPIHHPGPEIRDEVARESAKGAGGRLRVFRGPIRVLLPRREEVPP